METKPRLFSGCKMRASISQEIIRLETMMNDLNLKVDGAVNVATKNIF